MPRLKRVYHGPTSPAWHRLQDLGATIDVQIELHPSEAAEVVRSGETRRSPASGEALIDTGASLTVIDEKAIEELQPQIIEYVPVKGFSDDKPNNLPICFVRITFPDSDLPLYERPVGIVPLASKTRQQIVLLGRDFLREYRLIYDGRQGEITLERP